MSNLVPAQAAAAVQDWSLVNTYLAQMAIATASPTEQSQMLDLALQVLAAEDFQDGWEVIKILPALGEMAIEPLLAMLQDDNLEPETQWLVGKVLGQFRSATVAAGLAKCLQPQPDSELAEIAINALTQMGEVAIDQLTALLAIDKLTAVIALAQIRHSQTIAPLLTVVDDPEPHIRYLAIEALSSFHDSQIPPVLLQKLTDPAAAVRQAAVTGLGLRSDLPSVSQLVLQLQPLLWDQHQGVAQATAIALGRWGNAAAAQALFTGYQQAHCLAPLQRQIVRSLGWIDRPVALQHLQTILSTAPLEVLPEVIRSLGQSRRRRAVQILSDYLRILPAHYPALIKQEIAWSLGNFPKTAAVEEIIKLLADPSEQVRWHAIYCLQQLDLEVVSNQLQSWRSSNPHNLDLLAGIEQCLLALAKK
jgi:HEAT repeat protein